MRWALALPVAPSTGRAAGLAEIERRHLVDLDMTELPLETIGIPDLQHHVAFGGRRERSLRGDVARGDRARKATRCGEAGESVN